MISILTACFRNPQDPENILFLWFHCFNLKLKILLQLLVSCSLIVFVVKEGWRCVYIHGLMQTNTNNKKNKHSGLYIDPTLYIHIVLVFDNIFVYIGESGLSGAVLSFSSWYSWFSYLAFAFLKSAHLLPNSFFFNCVNQLKIETLDKLSSPIFCCQSETHSWAKWIFSLFTTHLMSHALYIWSSL